MYILTNENSSFWQTGQSQDFAVLCDQTNPRIYLGKLLGYIKVRVPSWSIRDKDKPIFMVKFCQDTHVSHISGWHACAYSVHNNFHNIT